MSDAEPQNRVIRTVSLEQEDGCRSVIDIKEYFAPDRIEGSRSFTAISKDEIRRQLMVGLALEVDRMLAGDCTEIHIQLIG